MSVSKPRKPQPDTDTLALLAEGRAALDAGDGAAAQAAFEAAVALEESAEAYEGLGLAFHLQLEYRSSRDAYERAYGLYRQQRDAVGAFRASRMIAMFHGGIEGEWALFHGWLGRAATLLEEVGGEASLARLELLRGQFGGVDDATKEAHFRQGLAIARRVGDAGVEFHGLAYLGAHLVNLDRIDEGMPMLDEALAAVCAGEVTDTTLVDEIFCVLLAACERAHDVARAEQWMRESQELAARFNMRTMAALCRSHYGGLLTDAGRWAEAEAELLAAADLFTRGHQALGANAATRLADLRVRQGRFEDAAALLKGLDENPDAARPLAALHYARGDLALARDRIERTLAQPAIPAGVAGPLLALLVDVQLAAGDCEGAAVAADRLGSVAADTPLHYLVAHAALAKGKVCVATTSGDARACLVEALAAFSRAEMPVDLARARVELARAVAGDEPEVAIAEANAALEAFDKVKATRDADAALALLRSLGTASPARGRSGETLTRREAEVLELLGLGLSNPEIGDRLFISRKTVEHHVGRILGKLGLRSRAEAAAYVGRNADNSGPV